MTPERWKQIEELYHTARALPPDERDAFVAGACPDDDALRREVESLLNEPDSDTGFLGRSALVMPADVVSAPGPHIKPGESIGGYQVQALLGAGGMGDVYRARDAKLGRDVAIKILPRAFTSDPDRLARFEREARALAALNHPNVCAIYGVEEAAPSTGSAQAVRFLILELVEGDTLADVVRARSRGLPLPDALGIARQIADALEVAHDKGIVHRDLKPANIKITPGGVVKVLDFGLAKTTEPAESAGQGGAPGDTRAGIILGTAAYMSPEQARGKTVDRRSDVWAFGCVLYEMLTGRGAFDGETVSDTIGKILEREPDWTLLPAGTPASIRRLLLRCLAKEPKQRLRDVADVRIEIDAANDTVPGDSVLVPTVQRRARAWLPWATTAVLAIGLVGLIATRPRPATVSSPVRFSIVLPADQRLNASRGAHIVAISPDGRNIVYSGTPHGLYLRSLSNQEIALIPGTELYEATDPVFSPDGRFIAFFSIDEEALRKIPLTGGAAQTVCEMRTPPSGIRWEESGIVFGHSRNPIAPVTSRTLTDGITRVPADGGTPQVLVRITEGESAHGPQILPGGTHVLFTLATGDALNRWDKARMIVQSIATGDKTDLGEGSDARYLETGHLIYAVSGSLYAVPFDLRTLTFKGDRAQVIQGVRRAAGNFTGATAMSVADNGTLIYVEGPPMAQGSTPSDLGVMDRAGLVQPLHLEPLGPYATPRVSPDGTLVAFGSDDGRQANVYTAELSGASRMLLLTTEGNNRDPVWASDSRHVAFQSDRGGDLGVWWQTRGGAAERLTTAQPGTAHAPESWSGDTLLYSVTSLAGVSLWTHSLRDGSEAAIDAEGSSAPMQATISPDGRWMAYTSTHRSQITIFVQGFPRGPRYPLAAPATDTPKHPRWAASGRELCYDPNVSDFECIRVDTAEPFSFGKAVSVPKTLQLSPPGTKTPYDILPDGRFVGLVRAGKGRVDRGSSSPIQVVENWFEELKQRAPRR